MDAIKQQLARIQQQVGALSASQRMLVASLVALMVLTVLFWGRYAANPDRVAVLEQSFPPDQAARVLAELERQGVTATVGNDGRIMVPSDRRMQALAAVAYNRMLPSNSSAAVDKIVGQMTLWDSAAKTEKLWNDKRQVLLAQIIGQFPGVDEAAVQIDPAERRGFSAPSQPRAAINIRMRDGQRPGKQLVLAAADWVVGSQSGLTRGNVRVIVDGVSYPMPELDPDGGMGATEILGQKQDWERFYANKVREVLAHVRNPMVGVNVDLNTKRVTETTSEVDPKKFLHKELESSTSEDVSTQPPMANEPGAIPNVGGQLAAASSNGGSTTGNTEKTSFRLEVSRTDRTVKSPPGDATVTAASVRIPRSHFVAIYKQLNPKVDAPDETALAQLITTELEKVRKDVMACTGLKDPQQVMVDYYVEAIPEPLTAGSGQSGAVLSVVGGYGKEVALGVLALAALFMMSGIVKKGAGGVPAMIAASTAEQQREMERLAAGEEVVGSATEGVSALEALELDEETSATQQMVNQVTNMVKENPDAAVSLVKRWMNRT